MKFVLKDLVVSMKVIRKMIVLIQNQQWKDVRSSITPAFTTGNIKRVCIKYHFISNIKWIDHQVKLFQMSALFKECGDRLVIKFKKLVESQGKINTKE